MPLAPHFSYRPHSADLLSLVEHMRWGTIPTGRLDNRATLAIFSILIGLLSATLSGYLYGGRNLAVHLPEIFRALHPSYLAHDFWLNSASQFGPRFYYTQGILSRQISFRFRQLLSSFLSPAYV